MKAVTGSTRADGQAPAVAIELAAELAAQADVLALAMAAHLHQEIPELQASGELLLEETRASCQSNLEQSLSLLGQAAAPAELVVTPQARRYLRTYIDRGLDLPVLLRTYRLGHSWMWEQWTLALRERVADPEELSAVFEFSSRWMFAYVDLVSAALVEEFAKEQAQLARGADQLRAEVVKALLAGEAADIDTSSGRIGYELRGAHTAMRIWSEDGDAERLGQVASEAAARLGCDSPLIVVGGVASLDVWCHRAASEAEGDAPLAGFEPPEGVSIALAGGAEHLDLEGFRFAHEEVRQAARVKSLASEQLGPVVRFSDVELVALLSTDLALAGRFVKRRLGDLAAGGEAMERLRETLLAYLTCNRSSTQAAKRLFVHQNTVAYRINRIEEILGRPVADEQTELICALLLAPLVGFGL
jgi:DNA-binding PucR family transcriptional regulator